MSHFDRAGISTVYALDFSHPTTGRSPGTLGHGSTLQHAGYNCNLAVLRFHRKLATDQRAYSFKDNQRRDNELIRSTRSGRAFASWDGPSVNIARQDFDFKALMKTSVDIAHSREQRCILNPLRSSQKRVGINDSGSEDPSDTSEDDRDASEDGHEISKGDTGSQVESATSQPSQVQGMASILTESTFPSTLAFPVQPLALSAPPASSQPGNPSLAATSSSTKSARKLRQQAASHKQRKERRNKVKDQTFGGQHQPRQSIQVKYVTDAEHKKTKFSMKTANVASTGYVGLDDRIRSKKIYQLSELVGEGSLGFDYLKWDGVKAMPIVSDDRIMAILAGHPPGSSWPAMARDAADALENARRQTGPSKTHRRGAFTVLKCGVSHGGGRQKPGNMRNTSKDAAILEKLNAMEPFQRLAGFSSSVMATWAPDLYQYYVSQLGELFAKDPSLKRNFTSSVFTGASYNLGPRTACFRHKDFANLPFGWCAITALGSFNPKTSGHLILWDCKLVIEFPPGSTVLIPSAVLAHSNTAVGPKETRFSFTQYSAGALFCWVDRGFRTVKDYVLSLSQREKEVYAKGNARHWDLGRALLPQLEAINARTFK